VLKGRKVPVSIGDQADETEAMMGALPCGSSNRWEDGKQKDKEGKAQSENLAASEVG
jgi:hypothetical protein